MARRYVITGSASGMGAATRTLLEREGADVIGVDVRDADVVADLGTVEGRAAMVEGVFALAGGVVDGVMAVAGVAGGGGASAEVIVRVNYFGALASVEGLLPLLAASQAPRVTTVASLSGVLGHLKLPFDDGLVEACLAGDEAAAVAAAEGMEGPRAYASAKRALITWCRRAAVTDEWAGRGIVLNVVAPGVIRTPINTYLFATPEKTAEIEKLRPQPLGWGAPEHVASLLAWLNSAGNAFVTGQLICIDGGYEALKRPDVF